MAGLRIGEVANQAGVSTPTIRYYERAGLMPKPARSDAGYRLYSQRAIEELTFVRRAQAMGFSLDEIRGLLQLSRGGVAPCARVIALAETHLTQLEERIQQLHTFRDQLADALNKWRGGRCGFSSERLCDLLDDVDATSRNARFTGSEGRSLDSRARPSIHSAASATSPNLRRRQRLSAATAVPRT